MAGGGTDNQPDDGYTTSQGSVVAEPEITAGSKGSAVIEPKVDIRSSGLVSAGGKGGWFLEGKSFVRG
jgi:hypothetical protein